MRSSLQDLRAPDALRDLPGWLVWRFEPNGDKKPRKMPYYISGAKRHWTQGTAADRKNLTTFDQAKAIALARGYEGVGLALMPEFGVSALDFDDCVSDGVIDPVVESLTAGTYTEFSPSGNGIRAFVVGSLGTGKSNPKDKSTFGFEVFDCNGFVTFTGNLTGTAELVGADNYLAPISPELKAFRDMRLSKSRQPFEYEGTGDITLGLSDAELNQILAALPNDLDYDAWVNSGMAIHHETQGEGFALWDEWSLSGPKGTTTEYNMERWASFGRNGGAPFTARSLLRYARDELQVDTGIDIDTASPDDFPTYVDGPRGKFGITSDVDFVAQQSHTEWLVKGFLPKAQLGVLFGESGSGKSFAALDMCAAISRGLPDWNGHRIKPGRVLYVVAEGVSGFRQRIRAYCHQHALSGVGLDVISDLTPNLLDVAQVTDLIKDIRQQQPYDLIVMDTFAQVMPGANENSGEDVGLALAQCKRINRHTGAMVLLVHHSGKDSAKGARGWSGLKAACDVELQVERANDTRSITSTKMKDGQEGLSYLFNLHTVILGEDEDGDEITSCIVEFQGSGKVKVERKAKVGANELALLDAIHQVLGLGKVANGANATLVHAEFCAQFDPSKRQSYKNQAFKRAKETLLEKGDVFERDNTFFIRADSAE